MDNCNTCSACKPRQYIGPRFVPILSNPVEWENDRTYEQLVIVTYKGASYTSRKPVPPTVGNPADNPEYWALTGNYNAQVEEYRQAVEDVKDDLDEFKSEVTEKFENLDKEYYLFIGDSYALSSYGNWPSKLANLLNLANDEFSVVSEGGSSFTDGSWLTRLQNWATENPSKTNEVTKIICAGGINDCAANVETNLPPAMVNFSNYAKTSFPNAKLYVGFVGWITGKSAVYSQRSGYQTQVLSVYKNKAINGGFNYLSGVDYVMYNRNYITDDGIHPNNAGGDAIANALYESLINGYADYQYFGLTKANPVNGTVRQGDGYFRCILNSKEITFYNEHMEIDLTTPIIINNTWTTILTNFNILSASQMHNREITLLLRDSTEQILKSYPASVRVTKDGEFQVKLLTAKTISEWESVNANRITFPANVFSCNPTIFELVNA